MEGKIWKTSEHYFQAKKFSNLDYQEKIRLSSTPMQAANLGRGREYPIVDNWEDIKIATMRRGLKEKFSQNQDIPKLLLETFPEEIVEDTKEDYFWGIGSEGNGKNMLGKLLVSVREELRREKNHHII
ncbi:swarming motility protein [Bacilli bacterium]|nr:swarming motility protein [Bacilli bacterium]